MRQVNNFYCMDYMANYDAAVDPKGGERFILELPRVDTEVVNIFLKELSEAYSEKNILLIWDQAGFHKAK
ncbi:MAG TPA: hypothetical protein DCR81_00780, partial [Smithella sp.]|nr:hypothetical protein [Smithella sp.]